MKKMNGFLFLMAMFVCCGFSNSTLAAISCDDEPRITRPNVVVICNDRDTALETIYLHNLNTAVTTTVATGGDYDSVDVSKDYVVYTQGSDLHIYEISSASETVLPGVATAVRISGLQVLYINSFSQLEAYKIDTATTVTLSAAGQFVQHFAIQSQRSAYSYLVGGVPEYNTINFNPRTFLGGLYGLLPTSATMIRENSLEIDQSIPFWIESYFGVASGTIFLSFSPGTTISIAPSASEEITYGDLSVSTIGGTTVANVIYDSYDTSTNSWSIKSQRVTSAGPMGAGLTISSTDPTSVKMLPKIDGRTVIWLNETGVGNLKEVRAYDLLTSTESVILP